VNLSLLWPIGIVEASSHVRINAISPFMS
jgi:hypothetical protein